jgi:hypothetical protein
MKRNRKKPMSATYTREEILDIGSREVTEAVMALENQSNYRLCKAKWNMTRRHTEFLFEVYDDYSGDGHVLYLSEDELLAEAALYATATT